MTFKGKSQLELYQDVLKDMTKNGPGRWDLKHCAMASLETKTDIPKAEWLIEVDHKSLYCEKCFQDTATFRENNKFEDFTGIVDALGRPLGPFIYLCNQHNFVRHKTAKPTISLGTTYNLYYNRHRNSEIIGSGSYEPETKLQNIDFYKRRLKDMDYVGIGRWDLIHCAAAHVKDDFDLECFKWLLEVNRKSLYSPSAYDNLTTWMNSKEGSMDRITIDSAFEYSVDMHNYFRKIQKKPEVTLSDAKELYYNRTRCNSGPCAIEH